MIRDVAIYHSSFLSHLFTVAKDQLLYYLKKALPHIIIHSVMQRNKGPAVLSYTYFFIYLLHSMFKIYVVSNLNMRS